MKKLILLAFMALSVSSFAQTVKNGTIYKSHPYITIVNALNNMFPKGDTIGMSKYYADTAKFYDSPDPKRYSLKQAISNWHHIYEDWEQISLKAEGYPDGLEYTGDAFTVQSWWKISCVNKKTKKKADFEQVIFDTFNKDGKITSELSYYDTSSIMAAIK